MVFGTFDYLHAGHENFLKQAKALGDFLIVIIARDYTVKKIKGKFPEKNERRRLAQVKILNLADKVVLGSLNSKYKVIKKYRPDIIALGYDQFVFTYQLKKVCIDLKLNAEIIRLNPYQPEIFKSSLLKK